MKRLLLKLIAKTGLIVDPDRKAYLEQDTRNHLFCPEPECILFAHRKDEDHVYREQSDR